MEIPLAPEALYSPDYPTHQRHPSRDWKVSKEAIARDPDCSKALRRFRIYYQNRISTK